MESIVTPTPGDVVILKGESFSKYWGQQTVRPGDRGVFYEYSLYDDDKAIGHISWNDTNVYRERDKENPGFSRSGISISHPVILSKLRLVGKTNTVFWCWDNKRSHPTQGLTEERRDRYELEVNLWEWDGIQRIEPTCCLLNPIDVSPFEGKSKQKELEAYLHYTGFSVNRRRYGDTPVFEIGDFSCWQVREGWNTSYLDPEVSHYYGQRLYRYQGNYSEPFSAALNRYFGEYRKGWVDVL